MKTLIPRYNSARMVMDYLRGSYAPAAKQTRKLRAAQAAPAKELAAWKARVRERWPGVKLAMEGAPAESLHQGEQLPLEVTAQLNGLEPGDVVVECLLERNLPDGGSARVAYPLAPQGGADGTVRYHLELQPFAGLQHFGIRVRPAHAALSHPFELGLLTWL